MRTVDVLTKIGNALVLSVLSALVLAGLYFLALGFRNLGRAFASTDWPTAPGVVLTSGVSESRSRDRETGATSTTYSARITFGYQVSGRDYTTGTVRFGQTTGSGDSSEAELLRLRYPAGARVTVAYHPQNPSIAAVKPGFTAEALWLPGVGLGLALAGVMCILLYLSSARGAPAMGLGLGLFGILFILAGGAMLAPGLLRLWRARASQSWPATRGVIMYAKRDSDITVTTDSEGARQRSTTYAAGLAYQYEVDGRKYFSNTRRFGALAGAGQEWADEILSRYPAGAEVPVTYCPDDPELAVLEPGIDSEAYYLPAAGAAVLLFGLGALVFSFRF